MQSLEVVQVVPEVLDQVPAKTTKRLSQRLCCFKGTFELPLEVKNVQNMNIHPNTICNPNNTSLFLGI